MDGILNALETLLMTRLRCTCQKIQFHSKPLLRFKLY